MKTIFRDRKIQTFISNSDVLDLQFLVFGQSGSCPFQFAQKSANFGRFLVIKKYHNLSQIWPEIGQKSQSFGLWAASVWPDSLLISNTGGPLDMRILGLVKTRISGKSHSENHKVVIHMCMIFKCV